MPVPALLSEKTIRVEAYKAVVGILVTMAGTFVGALWLATRIGINDHFTLAGVVAGLTEVRANKADKNEVQAGFNSLSKQIDDSNKNTNNRLDTINTRLENMNTYLLQHK